MDALKKRRSVIKGQMTKIVVFAEAIKANTTHEEIKARLDKTHTLWNEFAKVESDMFEVDAKAESHTDDFDESYYRAVALLTASIRHFHAHQLNTSVQNEEGSFQVSTIETKLPRLNIPIFQGDYQEWQSFFDLFNSSVHEKVSLAAAQKLQYLKSLLKGEPLGLIRHLSVTDANYIEAYQILSKRYDKKKTTINSYIETFFNQPSITRINSSNIRKLANTTEEIIRGLKAVGSQGEARDPWLIYIVINKLDDQSRQFWQHESSKIEYPKIQDLIDCLLTRADTLEGIQEIVCKPAVRIAPSVRRTHLAIPSYVINCPMCNTEHMLYQCTKFKDMSIAQRRSYIHENSRCYNCLSDSHPVQSCRSKRSCQICKKRHNSLLHLPNSSKPTEAASQPSSSVQSALAANILPLNIVPINSPPIKNISSPNTLPATHDLSPINSSSTERISSINTPPTNSLLTKTISTFNTPSTNSLLTRTISTFNTPTTNSLLTKTSSTLNTFPMNSPSTENMTSLKIPQTENHLPPINHFLSESAQEQHVATVYEANIPLEPNPNHSQSLLPTALVYVKDASGQMQTCRVLLDSGSQASFVTEACVKRLALPKQKANVKIIGVGSSTAGISREAASLDIISRCDPKAQILVRALILANVALPLPSTSFHPTFWNHLKSIRLADPHYNESSTIDILIGADHFFGIITDGKIYGSPGVPIAQNSIFGWVVAGNVHHDQIQGASTVSLLTKIDVNQSLQQFWETEEIPSIKHLTSDEKLCEKQFEECHTRASDGRFIVNLPFKPNKGELGDSLNTAKRRFFSMENRLQRDPSLRDSYVTFLREYISLGHMKPIPPDEINIDPKISFYLPHHAVIKLSSTTTKVRVVFDGSSKTSSKISLNDNLLVGPTVQDNLYAILLRFRKHPFVFTADIEKMYRQISVNQTDTEYQRIVWRENPLAPLDHYRLVTVTYGTASAPYLATKTLIKLAEEFQDQYPIASKVVREDFYIDDLMTGANTEQEAHELKDQVINILNSGCFKLRKWTTNCSTLPDQKHLQYYMWPDQKHLQYSADQSENRPSVVTKYHAVTENKFLAELSQRYFKFSKLVRIVARIFHFINNVRRSIRNEPKEDLLSPKDLKTASDRIFKWTQMEAFSEEIKTINQQRPLPKSSKLVSLNPFIDENGLLRVGSRIRNANIQYDMKFPIILPANNIITELIIDETHIKYLHASQSTMIATIRQKYWIINLKTHVRQRIHKCIPCTRYKASKISQLMGDLPSERVNLKHAFYQTGVDYAGPIWLKAITGRKTTPHKAYIAIFVCLGSKAVHIELVSDLTTDAFIAALKRFMSRRGVSADMFSDNGTNFVGARNVFAELQKLNKSLKHNQLISNFLLESNTKWHFNPPSAPSFGGLWEAAVKSTKYHIRRVLGNTILNFEEMATFLTQIEAILNSRPLCLLSPHQEDPLTPSHFLIGQPLTMLPDPDYKPIKQNRLARWQLIQQLMQQFWARWHNEYLTTLHNRSKWQHKHKNLKIDDIVLVKEDNVSPATWPLGKIIETHPGKDGMVRVVTLRTKAGTIKRPITKLALLPLN